MKFLENINAPKVGAIAPQGVTDKPLTGGVLYFTMKETPGIYKIQSIIKPERIYIGSASDITRRRHEHLSKLRRSVHHNKKLQNHFNKYGEDDLIFSILLGCDVQDLLKHEQYFIDALNPWFNICKVAGNTHGYQFTDEDKKKMSDAQKGEKSHCYGKRGPLCPNYGRKPTIAMIESARIRMKGERNPMFGNTHTIEAREKISKRHKGKYVSKEIIERIRIKLMKPISQFSRNMEFIKGWESSSTASKILNIDNSTIVNVMRGNRKTAGGFIWKYKK